MRDAKEMTALDHAEKRGNAEVIALLEAAK